MLGAGVAALIRFLVSKESVHAAVSNDDGEETMDEETCCDCVAWVEHERQRKNKAIRTQNLGTVEPMPLIIPHRASTTRKTINQTAKVFLCAAARLVRIVI